MSSRALRAISVVLLGRKVKVSEDSKTRAPSFPSRSLPSMVERPISGSSRDRNDTSPSGMSAAICGGRSRLYPLSTFFTADAQPSKARHSPRIEVRTSNCLSDSSRRRMLIRNSGVLMSSSCRIKCLAARGRSSSPGPRCRIREIRSGSARRLHLWDNVHRYRSRTNGLVASAMYNHPEVRWRFGGARRRSNRTTPGIRRCARSAEPD